MSIRKSFEKYIENQKSLISKIEETIIPLQEKGLWNDKEFFNEMNEFFHESTTSNKNFIDEETVSCIIANALFRLDVTKPEVDVVKQVIQAFPGSLNCRRDSKGRLPIESLCIDDDFHALPSLKYVLTFALEGIKHNIGGEDMRGGLLLSSHNLNTLQKLSIYAGNGELVVDVMKDLRTHNLLQKKDVAEQGMLLFASLSSKTSLQFKFLAEWDPLAFLKTGYGNLPYLHAVIHYYKASEKKEGSREIAQFGFKQSLKYSLKYLNTLLFEEDDECQTAFERAQCDFGETDTMTLLKEVFPESEKFPLLHHVIIHQPEYFNLFASWFPWMCHLRDEHGRTVTQAMFAHGRSLLNENPMIWTNLQTDQMEEKDPRTKLRPFAAVATGEDCDLNLSFQLLRKHPSIMQLILEQREENQDVNIQENEVTGKRKRIGTVIMGEKKSCNPLQDS